MAINKVEYNGQTLIDLTTDTVTSETLMEGATAHDKAGNPIIGMVKPNTVVPITFTQNGTYTPSEGIDGYAPIKVDVDQSNIPDCKILTGSFTMYSDHTGPYTIQGAGGFNTRMNGLFIWDPKPKEHIRFNGIIKAMASPYMPSAISMYFISNSTLSAAQDGMNNLQVPDGKTEFVTISPDDYTGAKLSTGVTYNWVYAYTEV